MAARYWGCIALITVLFFASVRERLGCERLDVEAAAAPDLDSLQAHLCETHGAPWDEVLSQANIVRAVNQAVAEGNQSLSDGDEVAFFPPVTGG